MSMSLEQLSVLIKDASCGKGGASVALAVRRCSEYLVSARGDALRDFFRTRLGSGGREAFKELLSALFSLDDGSAEGWLAFASGSGSRQREASDALRPFLAPEGPLLKAVAWMDADKGVLYAFPSELLPERAKRLLSAGPQGLAALREALPYRGCLLEPRGVYGGAAAAGGGGGWEPPLLQLTPGRYFLFWMAYAAVRPGGRSLKLGACESEVPLPSAQPQLQAAQQAREQLLRPGAAGHRGGGGGTDSPRAGAGHLGAERLLRSALATTMQAAHLQPGGGGPQPSRPIHPYRDLVLGLLAHLAPLSPHSPAPPRPGAGAPPPGGSPAPAAGGLWPAQSYSAQRPSLRVSAEELVAILREFWVGEHDDAPLPFPVAAAVSPPAAYTPVGASLGGLGGAKPFTPSFQPPGEDRLSALRMLISYLAASPPSGPGAAAAADGERPPGGPAPLTGQLGGFGPSASSMNLPGAAAAAAAAAAGSGPGGALASLCGVSPLLATLLRPVYRLIRAVLDGWPADSRAEIKPLLQLWAALLLPWASAPRDRVLATALPAGALPPPGREDPRWRGYVEATAPFSTKLLEHWAAFACLRVQVEPAEAAALLERLLAVLSALGEGHLEALRALERAHNAQLPGVQGGGAGAEGVHPAKASAFMATLVDWEAQPAARAGAVGAGARVSPGAQARLVAPQPVPSLAYLPPQSPRTPGLPPAGLPPIAAAAAASALPVAQPLHVLADPSTGVAQWVAMVIERIERESLGFGGGGGGPLGGLGGGRGAPRTDLRLRLQAHAYAVLRIPPGPEPGVGGGAAGGTPRAKAPTGWGDDAVAAEGLERPLLARRTLADRHLRHALPPPLMMPISSREVPFLVRPLVALSLALTRGCHEAAAAGYVWVWAGQWRQLPLHRMVRRVLAGAQVNLRPLAETAMLGALAALYLAVWAMRAIGRAIF